MDVEGSEAPGIRAHLVEKRNALHRKVELTGDAEATLELDLDPWVGVRVNGERLTPVRTWGGMGAAYEFELASSQGAVPVRLEVVAPLVDWRRWLKLTVAGVLVYAEDQMGRVRPVPRGGLPVPAAQPVMADAELPIPGDGSDGGPR